MRQDTLVPKTRIILALMIPKNEIHAGTKEPTNDNVDAVDSPSLTSSA